MTIKLKFIGILTLPLCSGLTYAGGPLVLAGPSGNTPVTYQNPDIIVHVENGSLGVLTNAEADTILLEAFNLWNNVNTSTISLSINETLLDLDINLGNFATYLPPNISSNELKGSDGLNPVVYDNNGEIIDAFFGVGASNNTIGFSASIFSTGGSFFSEGYAVINGKDLGLTNTEFKLLIAHEMGHFLGLDHSQVNIDSQETFCADPNLENYPVMYPFVCRNVESLHTDEVSAVSALYPATNINNNFGILQGHFAGESGKAILGANIWAKNTTTGKTISIVSDYLKQRNGFYKMYLPAGNYTLHANSINTLFEGGSSVGPYSFSSTDASFVSPHPIAEVSYQGATAGNAAVITISTSQTLNIDFSITGNDVVINNNPATSDDDSKIFGATSFITLLFLFNFLIAARRLEPDRN